MGMFMISSNGGHPKIWGFSDDGCVFWGGLVNGGFQARPLSHREAMERCAEKAQKGYLLVSEAGSETYTLLAVKQLYEDIKTLYRRLHDTGGSLVTGHSRVAERVLYTVMPGMIRTKCGLPGRDTDPKETPISENPSQAPKRVKPAQVFVENAAGDPAISW